jgi:SMC interacting uncharacterized protein involved in chromosome segregation
LTPIDCDVFDCCASYIQEDYEDLDRLVPKIEKPKFEMKTNLCDDDEAVRECKLNFAEIMQKLSKERATAYNDMVLCWCFPYYFILS